VTAVIQRIWRGWRRPSDCLSRKWLRQ